MVHGYRRYGHTLILSLPIVQLFKCNRGKKCVYKLRAKIVRNCAESYSIVCAIVEATPCPNPLSAQCPGNVQLG